MAYERQYYKNGDVLNAEQLNHMESGIKENSDNIGKLSEDIADLKENGTGTGNGGFDEEALEEYLEENSQDMATLTIKLGDTSYSYNGGNHVTIDIPDADNTSY